MAFITVYLISHLAAFLAGPKAAGFVHDLTFSYSAILVGLLIGAVGVFLSALGTTATAIRDALNGDEAEAVLRPVYKSGREMRSNVLFALAMVGLQALVELLRLVDIPYLSWPITARGWSKPDVMNGLGISAAVLQFYAVVDSVKAMFTLGGFIEIGKRPKVGPTGKARRPRRSESRAREDRD